MLGTRRELMIDSALAERGTMRRIWLAGGIAAMALCATLPVQAQQYGSGTNVIVDYGALDQVGTPPPPPQNMSNPAPAVVTNPPAGYGTALQPYGAPQAQPVMPVQSVNPNGGALLPPPSTMPVSRLTVPYKPSPSVVDGSAPAPASMASSVTPPPPPKPAPTMPAPALKPAQPETKVVVVPTPPPAPQPPPAPVPKPVMPETVAEQAPPTPAATASIVPAGTSKDNGAAVSTNLPEPTPSATTPSATTPAAPAVETATTTTTAASNNATKTVTAAAATATETAAATETATATTTTASTAATTVGAGAATAATGAEPMATATPSAVAQNQTTETAPAAAPAAPAETTAPASASSQTAPATGDQPAAAPAPDKTAILFVEGSAELAPEAAQQLDGIAQKLDQNQALRLQLMAYASGSEDTASRARRISLSRALAVRAYLIDKGVRSTRMDVRALGNKVEGDPADRVDIVTLTP